MANILRRGERREGREPAPLTTWEPIRDPFRLVRDLMRWDPFHEMESFAAPYERGFLPAFDVRETKDAYVFQADLPGVREQDLEISLTGNRLTVAGKRELEQRDEEERYYCYERQYGAFSRSFTLPEGADGEHVRAEFKDGVLQLVIPKKPEVQAKRISIGPGGTKGKASS